jgi:D-beta-D-heptose 7-phosphate kinase / D-beta-D-heptose 1-phosphate adenosyltransferase
MPMQINIPLFEKARVMVVGDVMLDRYWHGDTTRISPEAPVPIVHVQKFEERAGGAGNVALNLSSIGVKTRLLGLVGKDDIANQLEKKLTAARVETHFEHLSNVPTINKVRIIGRNQQLLRVDLEEGFHDTDGQKLLAEYKTLLKNTDAVVLSDYGKGTLHDCQKFIAAARAANIPVLVDPKSNDFSLYAGATVITPNFNEFVAVVGPCEGDVQIADKALDLLHKFNFGAILVTRGAQGMSLITADQPAIHLPTRAREVYDVSGAGDTVIAFLAAGIACGESLADAMFLANTAAGIVVKKLGAATVSIAELRRALQRHQDPWVAVLDETQLLQQVADARAHGEKIVMTNGVFDILHAGHIIYLEKAKALGQRLIVAVNDDASVKRLKGTERPINSVEQRMLVLAALRAVDWVVPFAEDTPERLIKMVSPDFLVKGGDYKVHEIAGADHVTKKGGKVIIMPFENGFSTSGIVNKIKKTYPEK